MKRKNVFIINPVSGNKKNDNSKLKEIRDTSNELGMDWDVYFTKSKGDAENYIRRLCAEHENDVEPLRVFGLGGDGTVNEIANGIIGFENVEMGIIPTGTGNDYVRNYGKPEEFHNVRNQLLGKSRFSDVIKYKACHKGEITEGYCVNMFNIGFDCNVVDMTDRLKEKTFFRGSMAYLASVFITLVKKAETEMLIEFEDGTIRDGKVLLVSVANGCFCGGGIKGVPRCILDDGLMDISIVREGISRTRFVSLFPKYMKGTHLEDPIIQSKKLVEYSQASKLKITAKDEKGLKLCVDGEISDQTSIEFEICPKAIKFIVPVNLC